jgi:uncharacterized membrane protein YfcA
MLDLAKLMDCNLLWLGLIVLVSYTTQAMSGFGSTIIALTLGVHLYPIEVLLPVLVPLDMVVNLYIATRYHRHINLSLLFRSIIPAMGIGLLAGIITFHLLQGIILKKIFGFLVIVLSIRELYRLFKNISDKKILSRIKSNCYILSAGIIHGIYASGGPLLIYALSRLDLSKSVFRSTLGAVWLIFSVFLTASYLISGTFTEDSFGFIAGLLPLIIIGIILGEWLHHYIDEYRFKIFIFAVLLFAGLSISIS